MNEEENIMISKEKINEIKENISVWGKILNFFRKPFVIFIKYCNSDINNNRAKEKRAKEIASEYPLGSTTACILLREVFTESSPQEIKNIHKELKDRILGDEIRHYNNKVNITQKAKEEFDKICPKSDKFEKIKNIDRDKLDYFYETFKTVTEEEMQRLAGKILAEEINLKDSYSLRAMDTLRKMSASEIKIFKTLIKYSDNDGRIFFDKFSKYDKSLSFINFDQNILLEDLGLFSSAENIIMHSNQKDIMRTYYNQNIIVDFIKQKNSGRETYEPFNFYISCKRLSIIGKELKKLFINEVGEIEDWYFNNLKEVYKNDYNMKILLYKNNLLFKEF